MPPTSPSFSSFVEAELDGAGALPATGTDAGTSVPTSDGAKLTWESDATADLFGLALSGGGIRSATFNLGILQALNDTGLLNTLDYVSTVSGGGYIGAFWSAWRARAAENAAGNEAPQPDLFPATPEGRVEPPEIRHLREFSHFLSPRVGILAYDTGRMLVAGLSATVPAVLASLSFIVLVLTVWLVLAQLLLSGPASFAPAQLVNGTRALPATGQPLLTLGIITFLVFLIAEIAWYRRRERRTWWYVLAAATGLGTTLGAWYLLVRAAGVRVAVYPTRSLNVPFIDNRIPIIEWRSLFFPALIWLLAAVTIVLLRWLLSRTARHPKWRVVRSAFDRVTSRLLFSAAVWTVVSVLWVLGTVLWYWLTTTRGVGTGQGLTGLAGTAAALGVVFRTVHKLVARTPGPSFGGRLATLLKPKLPQLLAYATVAMIVVTVVAIMVWFETTATWRINLPVGDRAFGPPMAAALIVTLLVLLFFDPNEVGLHSFYRARLARAYLGASNSHGSRQTEEQDDDDFYLPELMRSRPLHLICCTANDLSSTDHLANLHRGAVSAVLSPVGFSVGSDWTVWRTDDPLTPTLASAITASGAAFNSHMGSKSMAFGPAVTFLMTSFNLRLGLWLPHPCEFRSARSRWLPGLPFYEELLGISRASGRHVHLSDGGHFENMALYELIRRHCRFIIASDCGADPDVGFNDLGNVVRRVREDFGVEIAIDLAPLRPGPDGLARQPMVAGDIHYPNGDVGVLLFFKPTLVGDEPSDITQYKRRNTAFPHESTGDQFYDEAQWEAYRRLGEHAARSAFRGVNQRTAGPDAGRPGDVAERRSQARDAATLHRNTQRWASRVFARARMRWLAAPPGLEQRIDRIAERAAELDTLLQKDDCGRILREVYKEIDELDRLARHSSNGNGGSPSHVDAPNVVAQPPGDAPPQAARTRIPQSPDLAPSLHLIRRAILFMEEIYLTENLERNYLHPLYLGVMNYFARWAYAPVFRMWWPLLKSLYAERFTSFLEQQFKLKGVASSGRGSERVIARLTDEDAGFAMHCWRLEAGNVPPEVDVVSYALQMSYQGDPAYRIQAAQVLVTRVGNAAVWDTRQYFVPPGLWGIGIGEDFLDRLVDGAGPVFQEGGPLESTTHLIVRIPVPPPTNPAKRKEGADLTHLYRAAGFRELTPVPAPGQPNAVALPLHDCEQLDLDATMFEDGFDSRWLVRCIEKRCSGGATKAAEPANGR